MSLTMGGAGVGVEADYNVMLLNPANLGTIEKTVFSALYTLDMVRISQSGDHTNFITGIPCQVSFGVPLGKIRYDRRVVRAAKQCRFEVSGRPKKHCHRCCR